MNDVQVLLERQANWQKSRQALSWPEKIRMAEEVRDSARRLRKTWGEPSGKPKSTPA